MEWSLHVTAIGVLDKGVRVFLTSSLILRTFTMICSVDIVGDSISSPYTGTSPSVRPEGVTGRTHVSNASWSHA